MLLPSPLPPARRRSILLALNWWQDRILRGVARYATTHNWEIHYPMRWTCDVARNFDWHGDGIISYVGISAELKQAGRALTDFVRRSHLPVVETQAFISHPDGVNVVMPHEEIGRLAAAHFLKLGFRHCGYVRFDDNPIEDARCAGFRSGVLAGGAEFHALEARTLPARLGQLPRPAGLFAMNDANALQIISMCRHAGAEVPQDFAVVGVDDTEIVCDFAPVPLSSVNCNLEQIGLVAAEQLDGLLQGRAAPANPVVVAPRGVTARSSSVAKAAFHPEVSDLLQAMSARFREPVSVQDIARDAAVNLRRVHRQFFQQVGYTTLQKLTHLRVEHAQRLLDTPARKIDTIAWESGFSNRFHFIAAFRRVTGETPTSYRRAQLAKREEVTPSLPRCGS